MKLSPVEPTMDIGARIRDNILAAGGDVVNQRIFQLTTRKVCMADAYACNIMIRIIPTQTNDITFIRNISCEECYKDILSVVPMRTFLDCHALFSELACVDDKSCCLVHPCMPDVLSHVNAWTCCRECRNGYLGRFAQMIELYFLAHHIGLLPELAQVVMWFIVRI
jgi:hypothetical protein